MSWVIFQTHLLWTVLNHDCCMGVISNTHPLPTTRHLHSILKKGPGLDNMLRGHSKRGLYGKWMKLIEAREANWNSTALMYSRQKGTYTELVARKMKLKWEAFFSTITNYLYLDLALTRFPCVLGFIIHVSIFPIQSQIPGGERWHLLVVFLFRD